MQQEFPEKPPELIELYALLVVSLGTDAGLSDVHDAWSIWQNRKRPDHRSIIPFNELKSEVQEMDRKYVEAIHRVVERLNY
jgi:hypothetical protein